MPSAGPLPWLQDGQPARGAPPGPLAQPDIRAPAPEKPLRTCARQAEEEGEDGGLFIPMGRLPFSFLYKVNPLQQYSTPTAAPVLRHPRSLTSQTWTTPVQAAGGSGNGTLVAESPVSAVTATLPTAARSAHPAVTAFPRPQRVCGVAPRRCTRPEAVDFRPAWRPAV